MTFAIVAFLKTRREIEIVPKNWLVTLNGKLYTYWPKYTNTESIYTAAKGKDPPNTANWFKYAVRSLHEFGKYSWLILIIP